MMIGIAPATDAAITHAIVIIGLIVVAIGAVIVWHNHHMHNRTLNALNKPKDGR